MPSHVRISGMAPDDSEMSVTLLHISDPHITEDPATVARLRQVLDLAAAVRPDAVVVTGDIADHGAVAEYRAFAAAMTDQPRWLAIPGNHDDPPTLHAELHQDPCPALDIGPIRVVGLDVTVRGENHGYLTPETARLAATRATGAERVVLAFHQPPIRVGHPVLDTMLLTNPVAVTDLVGGLPPVAAILCGHAHIPLAASLAGIPVRVAPGVASTLTLDPAGRPLAAKDSPPGLALHRIGDDGSIITTFHHTG